MPEITTWSEAVDAFDEMLDDVSGTITIIGLEYSASRVLREVDPIAYRMSLFDWLDSEGVDSDDLEGELTV